MNETSVSPAELELLRRLAQVGGRYAFKPDGDNVIAYRVFEQGIVSVLLSLHAKGLVRIDSEATEVVSLPGQPGRFGTITAELTEAGREAVR